jgi:hypothetical protein
VTITIELAPELQTELARQAAMQGIGIDVYAASLLEDAARSACSFGAVTGKPQPSTPSREVVEAIERLRSFGKTHGLSLGGATIRELRHEARP